MTGVDDPWQAIEPSILHERSRVGRVTTSKKAASEEAATKERILEASRAGEIADLSSAPARRRTSTQTSTRLHVDAEFLLRLLTGADQVVLHPRGVRLRGAHVGGHLRWDWQRLLSPLELLDCVVEDTLTLDHAQVAGLTLRECQLTRVSGRELHSDHSLNLANSQFSDGLDLSGARVAGSVDLTDARLSGSPGTPALLMDAAEVAGDVLMQGGFRVTGEVRLLGASIGGSFDCSDGVFQNDAGHALAFDRATVGGHAFLRGQFSASGTVRLTGARIRGALACSGGSFANAGGDALLADSADISGDVLMHAGFSADGEVRLPGAKVGGGLICLGAAFANADGDALTLDGAEIAGDVLLRDGATFSGRVRLQGVRIGADLDCRTASFYSAEGATAVSLRGATVSGTFHWRDLSIAPTGTVDLTRCSVGELDDELAAWPPAGRVQLVGFSYARLGPAAPTSPAQRLEWVRRQPGYSPQPYQQLAAVYRASGHLSEAKAVAVARQEDLRSRGDLNRLQRAWNRFLGVTIGHGYRPERTGWALLALFFLTALPVWIGAHNNAFLQTGNTPSRSVTSSHCGSAYPCFSWPAYALENITPILNLHQSENWQPDRSRPWGWVLRDWLYLTTILGWTGTTLLAAALGGLAQGD